MILDQHHHKERLIEWSKKEPKRSIYLVVHGAGLDPQHMQRLRNMFLQHPAIHIVDFDKIDLGTNDFTLTILKKDYKVSELLRYRYQEKLDQEKIPKDSQIIFQRFHSDISMGCWIDLMRILMLRSIKDITGASKAIYMDFDFHIGEKGNSIGIIRLPRGIAFADGKENDQLFARFMENGAIAISDASQPILEKMIDEIKKRFSWTSWTEDLRNINSGAVYGAMVKVIDTEILSKSSGRKEVTKKEEKHYLIQENGGNIKLKQDRNSWG